MFRVKEFVLTTRGADSLPCIPEDESGCASPFVTLSSSSLSRPAAQLSRVRRASPPRRGEIAANGAPDTREQTADEQVKQALNRLAFGARPGDAERVRAMGVDKMDRDAARAAEDR